MVVNKRKKHSRLRGSNTYGWGKNQHRGAGSRGGRGNAGTGKKCDANKPSIWGTKEKYFGPTGFVSMKQGPAIIAINLRDIQEKVDGWTANKQASKEGDVIVIDLATLGYHKLLSTGKVSHKLKITVQTAAKNVGEKLKAAGGELVLQ